MIHQKFNSVGGLYTTVSVYNGRGFPEHHIHHGAELLYVTEGEAQLRINNTQTNVKAGQLALVLPNQAHSFDTTPDARCTVQVFSTGCAPGFFSTLGSRVFKNPVIDVSSEAAAYWHSCCLRAPRSSFGEVGEMRLMREPGSVAPLKLRSALYAVLSEFLETELVEREGSQEALFGRVSAYVIEHCTEDLTLESVAAEFGYEPHYFSRCLKQVSDFNFRRLINRCRIDLAIELLEESKKSITEVSLACGFTCQRTFNRVFMQLEGVTPQEHRERFSKIKKA